MGPGGLWGGLAQRLWRASAVRFFAAALDAFLARALRCAALMFFAAIDGRIVSRVSFALPSLFWQRPA
jgi:hypothetical protein